MNTILEQARLLLEQGRAADAENRVKQFLQQEPDNDYALSLLARCLYHRKLFDEGMAVLRNAISIEPEQSFYYYLLGFGYYQKDDHFQAIANLEKAIRLNAYYAEYYGLMAFVLLGKKDFNTALQKANEGLAIEAENITCLNARAMALNKLRKTDEAIATMEFALAQDPDSEFTHNTVGWNLLERGRHREAATHFRESLRINPMMEHAKGGLKEALKSRIPPYKWLLQYSFWVNNHGRRLKVAMPIIIYISFRVLFSFFTANRATQGIGLFLGGLYLLFVVGSWTMNSIANCFLLMHPDGRYALSNREKWSAIAVVTALLTGCIILLLAVFTSIARGSVYEDAFLASGLICFSLALSLGEIDYPIRLRKSGKRSLFSVLLTILALLTIIGSFAFPAQALQITIGYGIAFLVYNWSGVLRYR